MEECGNRIVGQQNWIKVPELVCRLPAYRSAAKRGRESRNQIEKFGDVGFDLYLVVTMKGDNIEQKVKISILVMTWELMSK